MKEWFIASGLNLCIGFVIGWIVFQRPQFATDLINKIRAKIGI